MAISTALPWLLGAPAAGQATDFDRVIALRVRPQDFGDGVKGLQLRLGKASPTGTNGFDGIVGGGLSIGLQYMHFARGWLGLGGELDMSSFNGKTQDVLCGELAACRAAGLLPGVRVSSTRQAKATTLLFLTRFNLMPERAWTPFALGGVGFGSFKLDRSVSLSLQGQSLSLPSDKGSSTGLAVAAGGGVEGFVLPGFSLSLEVRYLQHHLKPENYAADTRDFQTGFNPDTAESLSWLIGVRYSFGGN